MVVQVSFVLFWLVACSRVPLIENAFWRPTPPLPPTWDTNPETRTVLVTYCCDGPVIEELVRSYIPEAQVWGDGRYLWTGQDDHGVRQVFIKQLTTDEMIELLQGISVSGFFDWEEEYMGEPVVDAASQCVTVALTDKTKTVCAIHGGAPDAFYTLFAWIAQGAGMSGSLYSPDRAYLTGFELVDLAAPLPEPDVAWPESLANVPVTEAITGLWLDEGETLRLLWEATNRNPYYIPIVEDGDGHYRIILQIPALSWIEPQQSGP